MRRRSMCSAPAFLNEVLSLNAQESHEAPVHPELYWNLPQ